MSSFATSPVVSHSDASRNAVGLTALMVAAARALVSTLPEAERLIVDPYAEYLAGDHGRAWIAAMETASKGEAVDYAAMPPEVAKLMQKRAGWDHTTMMNKMAVRTRWIDDALRQAVIDEGAKNVVIIGAGLDTRPWRLLAVDELAALGVTWYEVDFQELFDYKLPILAAAGAAVGDEQHKQPSAYHSVATDLTDPAWPDSLKLRGYDPSAKTVFLLEGLTGYLTEDELTALIFAITSHLCTPGAARLVATFLGTRERGLSLHRFKTDTPLDFISNFGWYGEEHDFEDLLTQYGKPVSRPEPADDADKNMRGRYFLVDVRL